MCLTRSGISNPRKRLSKWPWMGWALPPAQVLFLDDGAANLRAAGALGINAHVVKNPEQARVVLETYGVLTVPTALP